MPTSQVVLAASEDPDLWPRREGGQEDGRWTGGVYQSAACPDTLFFFLFRPAFTPNPTAAKYLPPRLVFTLLSVVSTPLWPRKHDISQLLGWK